MKPRSADVTVVLAEIKATGANTEEFVKPLLALLDTGKKDDKVLAAEALGQFGAFRDRMVPRLQEKARNSTGSLRGACLTSLRRFSLDLFGVDPLFRKLANDQSVHEAVYDIFESIDNEFHPQGLGADEEGSLPDFPWPPPRYSTIGVFGRDFPRELLGDQSATLGVVYKRLYDALKQCDATFQSSLFQVPGGFALLSKMERIEADGTPLPGMRRWMLGNLAPLSLSDYVAQLFLEKPGFFRVIAFVITDQVNFKHGENKLPEISEGGTSLRKNRGNVVRKGRQCYALIYSFTKKPGSSSTTLGGDVPSASVHLAKAGVLDALARISK